MNMPELTIVDHKGTKSKSVELPKEQFGVHVHDAVIHQAVVMYRANRRQGTVSTKGRSEVSGGGKKPWRQKGTGRARHGSIRSPLWHKGGVTFGPHPRDFSYSIPKKIKRLALYESLNAKFQDKNLLCLEDIKKPLNKTKEFAKILANLQLKGKILACLDGSDPSISRVSKNIVSLQLMRSHDINAYDILRNKKLLISQTAFKNLLDRVQP